MHHTRQKEEFSIGYIQAMAAAAKCTFERRTVDIHSVDAELHSSRTGRRFKRPCFGVQAKCSSAHKIANGHISLQLKKKNYDDLRETDLLYPRLLVVVLVPEDTRTWIVPTVDQTLVKHCGFWVSLRGRPAVKTASVVIRVPAANVFSRSAIDDIMTRLGDGGEP